MNDCNREDCPFRSNHTSSAYGCDHVVCPNRHSENVTYSVSDHTITKKAIKKSPCEVCKYRKAMARLFDVHFRAEDCPRFWKCGCGRDYDEIKEKA